ncbi:hypothetical protein ACH5RR_028530 [Cinchona calisaya]|uniref:Uncharacterized protein n=1 Tax=Cinchona calisaya TaxID=153742 RepID=A0ABD2YP31_9GENT
MGTTGGRDVGPDGFEKMKSSGGDNISSVIRILIMPVMPLIRANLKVVPGDCTMKAGEGEDEGGHKTVSVIVFCTIATSALLSPPIAATAFDFTLPSPSPSSTVFFATKVVCYRTQISATQIAEL